MKVLIIYASEIHGDVERLRHKINEKFGKGTILRIKRTKSWIPSKHNPQSSILHNHFWHLDATKMIKSADMVVYVVSKTSSTNKNVEWELKKALKKKKSIICLNSGNNKLNSCLLEQDKYSKEERCIVEQMCKEDDLLQLISDNQSGNYLKLFNSDDHTMLIEQYKLFIETSENLLERRQKTNNFYVGVCSAILTISATIVTSDILGSGFKSPFVFVLALFGAIISRSWNRSLAANRINNKAKIKLISMIETKMSASLYDSEWKEMKNKYSSEKYINFTDNERRLTNHFFRLFLVVCIISFAFILLQICGVPITTILQPLTQTNQSTISHS